MLKSIIFLTFLLLSVNLNITVSAAELGFISHPFTSKVCEEDEFLNLDNQECVLLFTNFGFKGFEEPNNLLETCNKQDFVTKAAQGDITIKLPKNCEIDLDGGINIGSNTIIQGNEGVILTGIDLPSDGIAGLLQIKNKENVIIRNLEIKGDLREYTRPLRGVEIDRSKNVLVENIVVQNTEYQGIRCAEQPGGENITISKNYINDIFEWHGIACGNGNKNVLIASNLVERTSLSGNYPGYGLDIVSAQTEVAGNLIDKKNTASGVKVPGTVDLVFHHNVIKNANTYPGIRTYEGNGITPANHYYFNNTIIGGEIILTDANKVGLANNNFEGYKNGTNVETCTIIPNTNYKTSNSIVFNYGRGSIDICNIESPNTPSIEPTTCRKETDQALDYYFDFEGENPFNGLIYTRSSDNDPFIKREGTPRLVSNPTKCGNGAKLSKVEYGSNYASFRDETIVTDDPNSALNSGIDIQLAYDTDHWIGFSTYLPIDYQLDSRAEEIFFQIHAMNTQVGETGRGPQFEIHTANDEYQVGISGDYKFVTPPDGTRAERLSRKESYSFGNITKDKGKWVNWVVFYTNTFEQGRGETKVWKDGVLVVNDRGENTYNDPRGPFVLFGNYKWGWNPVFDGRYKTEGIDEVRIYHDEVRIASGSEANYEMVVPITNSQNPTTPPPLPTTDLSFDHNNDDKVDILDLIEIIKYLFK